MSDRYQFAEPPRRRRLWSGPLDRRNPERDWLALDTEEHRAVLDALDDRPCRLSDRARAFLLRHHDWEP